MRTTEERIAAIHQRAEELTAEKENRTARILQIGGYAAAAACLAIVILLAAMCARIPALGISGQMNGLAGSMFAENGALGYIVIGIVGFLFGIFATAFCVYLGRYKKRKHGEDEEL